MILSMNPSFPKILDLSGMSPTTALVVWTMIAFLAILLSVLCIFVFKNFYPVSKKKKPKSKALGSKGFGGLSN